MSQTELQKDSLLVIDRALYCRKGERDKEGKRGKEKNERVVEMTKGRKLAYEEKRVRGVYVCRYKQASLTPEGVSMLIHFVKIFFN